VLATVSRNVVLFERGFEPWKSQPRNGRATARPHARNVFLWFTIPASPLPPFSASGFLAR